MRLAVRLEGSLEGSLAAQEVPIRRAATEAIRETSQVVLLHARGQTTRALGQGIGNAWRVRHFPQGRDSSKPAALIYSRAPDIVDAHYRGALIRAKGGLFLAIPTNFNRLRGRRRALTEHFGQSGNVRISPTGMVRSRLAFTIPNKDHPGSLLWMLRITTAQSKTARGRIVTQFLAGGLAEVGTGHDRGRQVRKRIAETGAVPMFVLIPRVQLRKRLDLEASRKVAETDLAIRLDRQLERTLAAS